MLDSGQLNELIFVNDGSTDATADIAAQYPITVLTGGGTGPGAARNLGWKAASSELIWFIDSGCVAEPDALNKLLPHMADTAVAGVGGSYANLYPNSLIASLIHEEIVFRHRRMAQDVDFLATFNVIYRKDVLQQTGGFDESLKLAQDAELAYRIIASGHRLRFEIQSRVGHHHPRNLWRYLKTQARQGYFRVMLYRSHPGMMSGDSYAGLVDYLQPPVALLGCLSLLCIGTFWGRYLSLALFGLLFILQIPCTYRLVVQHQRTMFHFLWFGCVRALSRGFGLLAGALHLPMSTRGNPGLVVPVEPTVLVESNGEGQS